MVPPALLLRVLREPSLLATLDAGAWHELIPQARRGKLLSRLAWLVSSRGLTDAVPAPVRPHLLAAQRVAEAHERNIRWEVNRIVAALRHVLTDETPPGGGTPPPLVLLKGAAYLLAGLPPHHGRLCGDVDILVLRGRLGDVERALGEAGWRQQKTRPYDQRYYRQWMHELPPLEHATRKTVVDVHHAILPETGRLHPDSARLLAGAVPLGEKPGAGWTGLAVLSPVDMVLHAAAHCFQDGDLAGTLRDLVDLDDLLRYFGAESEAKFWQTLPARAAEMDLLPPTVLALRSVMQLLGTPVPSATMATLKVLEKKRRGGRWMTFAGRGRVMDWLVQHAVIPDAAESPARLATLARWLLYVRSHWLRMPAGMLVQHLFHQAFSQREPD